MDLKFAFSGAAESVFADAWNRDVRAAKLSALFRAYYRLRPLIPLSLRRLMQRTRNQRVKTGEQWYLPTEFIAQLAATMRDEAATMIHPWPQHAQFGFVLTHDIETSAGWSHVAKLADIEQELGFRSSWNVVPHKYKIDEKLLQELRDRDFEIGIHGYNHDGRLFWSEKEFRRRATAINAAIEKFGAVGFRAPMVHRDLDLLQLLDIDYDASCFDQDPFQPMPGGIGGIWPMIAGKLVELPYTLPQDHTLFATLGRLDTTIWEEKLRFLRAQSGMALMLTHPDDLCHTSDQHRYRDFLCQVQQEGGYWHGLPREAAQWWRDRDQSSVQESDQGGLRIEGPAAEQGVIAHCRGEGSELRFSDAPLVPGAAAK